MIPNILSTSTIKGYGNGYLIKSDESAMIQPMFPAANLAIRKSALQEVGFFDTVCKTSGEDNDICIRMLKTKWELFYEPQAVVKHKHRTSLRGLLKQWYGYGSFHPYIFKKHTPKCLEIVYPRDKSMNDWTSRRFCRILGIKVPLHIMIFVTPFYFFHAFLLLLVLSLIIKSPLLFALSFLGGLSVWLFTSGRAFLHNCIIKRNFRWIPYTLIRYLLNWAFVFAAFKAGLKIGVIYFAVTRGQDLVE
jgi:GT2 family glycosyltransferase